MLTRIIAQRVVK